MLRPCWYLGNRYFVKTGLQIAREFSATDKTCVPWVNGFEWLRFKNRTQNRPMLQILCRMGVVLFLAEEIVFLHHQLGAAVLPAQPYRLLQLLAASR